MITVTFKRDKGDGYDYGTFVNEKSVGRALTEFIVFELGYGGEIIDISETSVSVLTKVLGCYDTTTFSGTKEEMKLLIEAGCIALKLYAEKRTELIDGHADKIIKLTEGKPLLVNLSSGIILGNSIGSVVALAMLSEEYNKDIEKLTQLSLKDLTAAVELVRIDKIPLEDIINNFI